MVKTTNLILIATLSLLSLIGCQKKPNTRGFSTKLGITLDGSVPEEQRDLIDLDISTLYNLNLNSVSQNDLQIIGVSSFHGPEMAAWLKTRVSFIVGETFDYDSNYDVVSNQYYHPQIFAKTTQIDALIEQNSLVTIMINLGGALYRYGKQNSEVLSLDVGGTRVYIKSPRVGVIQIGEGLFSTWSVSGTDKDSLANSLIRLSVFFHEGRHSDGNGENVTFPHAMCPSGHDYAGNYSCDKFTNGPYVVDSVMLRNLQNACVGCSQKEINTFRAFQADAESRLLDGSTWNDIRPEQIP